MYLELFEYFVNNQDVPSNTELPLKSDILSAVYEPSSHFVEDNIFLKKTKDINSFVDMGGLTLNSIGECHKLACLFVNQSESIYKSLDINDDFKPFHCSLLELVSVLVKMRNILSSAIAKKDYYELAIEDKNLKTKVDNTEINTKIECKIKNELDSKIDDDHKEYDNEENEEKEKHDDSDSLDKNNMECMSWVFNEDITCSHGKNITK